MKTLAIVVAILICGLAHADPDTTITNYVPGYILVPSSFANAGDTGLATGTAYACVPVAQLTFCTEAEAAASGGSTDIRSLLFSLNTLVQEAIDALATSNQFAVMTITKGVKRGSTADVGVTHTITTEIDLGTTTLPAE